jgi:hypothetical protein
MINVVEEMPKWSYSASEIPATFNLQLNKTSSTSLKSNLFRGIKGFKHSKCSSVEANIWRSSLRAHKHFQIHVRTPEMEFLNGIFSRGF